MNEVIESIIAKIKESESFKLRFPNLQNWKTVSGIISNIADINSFVGEVILLVEQISSKIRECTSDDKLEAAATYVASVIKLDNPIYNLFVKSVAKIVISVIVNFFNRNYSRNWNIENVKKLLL